MVTFYVGMIKRNALTLEKVPALWRDAVAAQLGYVTEPDDFIEEEEANAAEAE